jgi:hypothetical protein
MDGSYAYIFVGSVLSTTERSDTEKRLELSLEEIFLGKNIGRLKVSTTQGACLPEIFPGDRWLFYLRHDDKTHEFLLDYGSPSKPIADAEAAITRLRRLAAMSGSGLILGSLNQELQDADEDGAKSTTFVRVQNHKVIAKRVPDGAEYSAVSDRDGNFEFGPLPSGSYHLSTNTDRGLWAEEGSATVHTQGCTAFQFELHANGGITGHVRSADGKPFKLHPWVEVETEDGQRFASFYADDEGFFEAKGLEPGRYLVGIGMRAEPETPEWRSRVYYPGVATKENATIIELGKAEKRENIDFSMTNSESR